MYAIVCMILGLRNRWDYKHINQYQLSSISLFLEKLRILKVGYRFGQYLIIPLWSIPYNTLLYDEQILCIEYKGKKKFSQNY